MAELVFHRVGACWFRQYSKLALCVLNALRLGSTCKNNSVSKWVRLCVYKAIMYHSSADRHPLGTLSTFGCGYCPAYQVVALAVKS